MVSCTFGPGWMPGKLARLEPRPRRPRRPGPGLRTSTHIESASNASPELADRLYSKAMPVIISRTGGSNPPRPGYLQAPYRHASNGSTVSGLTPYPLSALLLDPRTSRHGGG